MATCLSIGYREEDHARNQNEESSLEEARLHLALDRRVEMEVVRTREEDAAGGAGEQADNGEPRAVTSRALLTPRREGILIQKQLTLH